MRVRMNLNPSELVALETLLQAKTVQPDLTAEDEIVLLGCLAKVQRGERRLAFSRLKLAESVVALSNQAVELTEKRLREASRRR